MRLGGRLFFITIIYCSARLCDANERKSRHLLSLFGFKISGNHDLRQRPYLYSPIIIVPSLLQKQSVIVQNSIAEENYQESGDVLQRLSSEINDLNATNINSTSIDTDRIASNDVRHELNDSIQAEETSNYNLRLNDVITEAAPNNSTEGVELETTTVPMTIETTTTEREHVTESQNETNDTSKGPYPNATYNNTYLKFVTFTTPPSKENLKSVFALPENNESWKHFAGRSKAQVELYGDTVPYFHDNRWNKFAPLNGYFSDQFRPIAGLYHDGFLHRPLINKYGFVPSRQAFR